MAKKRQNHKKKILLITGIFFSVILLLFIIISSIGIGSETENSPFKNSIERTISTGTQANLGDVRIGVGSVRKDTRLVAGLTIYTVSTGRIQHITVHVGQQLNLDSASTPVIFIGNITKGLTDGSVTLSIGSIKETRLNDPDLLFAEIYSAGLCGDGKGNQGGCYRERYLFRSGELVDESGFFPLNGEKKVNPTKKTQINPAGMVKIIQTIKESGLLKENCPPALLMDVTKEYLINLDGNRKVFPASPPEICLDKFQSIETVIDSLTGI